MKRIGMLSCGSLLCVVVVTVGLAQQPEVELAFEAGDAFPADDPLFAEPADGFSEEAEAAADPEALRAEYLKRMQEKAALMDEAELKSALEAADQDIAELTAQRRLEEARGILEEIVAEYPHTDAGARARNMLRASAIDSNSPFAPATSQNARTRGNQTVPSGYQPL